MTRNRPKRKRIRKTEWDEPSERVFRQHLRTHHGGRRSRSRKTHGFGKSASVGNPKKLYYVRITHTDGHTQDLGPYSTKADAQRALRWQLKGHFPMRSIRVVTNPRAASSKLKARTPRGWIKAKAVRIRKVKGGHVVEVRR